jgi:hypothetical protein
MKKLLILSPILLFLTSLFGDNLIREYCSPAYWIWGTDRSPFGERGYFRRVFYIQKDVKNAFIQMSGDDAFTLFINGKKVGSGGFSLGKINTFEITPFLQKGKNVIAIEDYSPADPAGVILECTINYSDGTVETIYTDGKRITDYGPPLPVNGFSDISNYTNALNPGEFYYYGLTKEQDREKGEIIKWKLKTKTLNWVDIHLKTKLEQPFDKIGLWVRNKSGWVRFWIKLVEEDGSEYKVEPVILRDGGEWQWVEFEVPNYVLAEWSRDENNKLDFPLKEIVFVVFDVVPNRDYEICLNALSTFIAKYQINEYWKFSPSYEEGWNEPQFDDSHWRNAVAIGKPPIPPWYSLPFKYLGQDALNWKVLKFDLPKAAKAGSSINVKLRGKILSKPKGDNLAFLSIRKGDFLLIDRKELHTHPPLSNLKIGEEFLISTSLKIPQYAPSGSYEILIGLHQARLNGKEDYVMGKMEIVGKKSELPKAEIKELNGSPALFINDKPFFPMVYSQIPYIDEKHAEQFTKAGVQLYEINYVLGDFIRMGWKGEGQYDFSEFDKIIFNLLRVNPNAYFFPRLWLEPPDWWINSHPEELQKYADGTGWDKGDVFGGTKWPSFASEQWLKDEGEALKRFVEHIQSSPYAERCIGYHIGAGIYGEWHYMGAQYVPDTSEPMTRAFRKWLREHYNNDVEALRKAWGDENVNFDNAQVPTLEERLQTSFGMFYHPSQNRKVIDYYMCHHKVLVDAILHFAKIVKETSKGKSLVGVFFGYTSNMLWPQDGGHIELQRILTSPYIDFLCSPHTYVGRGLGQDGGFRALPGSIALHKKIFLDEADDGTYLAAPVHRQARNPEESISLMRREFVQALSINGGLWWFDMNSCWFDDYKLMSEIAKMKKIGDESLKLPRKRVSEVAVIVGLNSFYYTAHWRSGKDTVTDLLLNEQWRELFKMGAPFDLYDISDIDKIPPYKCYIFLNTFYMDEKTRKAIDKLKAKGGLFIWFYAPGLLNEKEIAVKNMEEITGMKMGLSLEQNILEVRLKDGRSWTNGKQTSPVIWVEDEFAEALGFSPDGKIAFALKKFPNWTSVYIQTPPAPSSILRELLRNAGIHIYIDSDDVLYANESFIAIHSAKEGAKSIRLPKEREVWDVFEGRRIGKVKEWKLNVPAYKTILFLLR